MGVREGGRLVHFPPFLKCQRDCFHPVLQANAPLSSINEGKYITMTALRKKWLIVLAEDNELNSVFCRTMCGFHGPGRRETSISPPQFLVAKYYLKGLSETKGSSHKSNKYTQRCTCLVLLGIKGLHLHRLSCISHNRSGRTISD